MYEKAVTRYCLNSILNFSRNSKLLLKEQRTPKLEVDKERDSMKKLIALVLTLVCVLGLVGCNTKSMDYIIENKPSVTGIVQEVFMVN